MASLNRQEIIGKLGRDPELKKSEKGMAYLFLGVATDDYVGKGPDGKGKYETTWHDVTVFGTTAEYVAKHAKKGSTVFVEGRTERKKLEGEKAGYSSKVIASNVIVIGAGAGASESGEHTSSSTLAKASAPVQTVADGPAEDDSELPF